MSRILKLVAGGMLAMSGMAMTGCDGDPSVETPPRTEGERLRLQAARTEKKAEMTMRAERLIAEGKGKQAEGQTLTSQGKSVQGAKMEAEGEALIREGQALRDQADRMETEVELDRPVSSTSSDRPTTRPVAD